MGIPHGGRLGALAPSQAWELLDLLDTDGGVAGTLARAEVVVPVYDGKSLGTDYALFDDLTGAVGLVQDDTGV